MAARHLAAAALGVAVLAGCRAGPPPGGIVSTNPCADAMLAELAPEQLRAISRYSRDPRTSSLPPALAARFDATEGTAEEVIARRPSLVVASSFTAVATQQAYRRAGLRLLLLDSPVSIAASQAQVRVLAAAVGEPARGEAMVARIDRALVAASPADARQVPALIYLGGDLVSGGGTLLHELLGRTGFADMAAAQGLSATGTLAVERLALHPPAIILAPDGGGRSAALRRRVLAGIGTTREARFPRTLSNCGGPTIVHAAARLAEIRREIAR